MTQSIDYIHISTDKQNLDMQRQINSLNALYMKKKSHHVGGITLLLTNNPLLNLTQRGCMNYQK